MPPALARLDNRIVRPRDAEYVDPWAEFRRLVNRGVLQKVATGYYLLPPDDARARGSWRPSVEAVALGIAVADYGVDAVALMGISAARIHAAIPRALAGAVVAVPKQRPRLQTEHGVVRFVVRRTPTLDRVRTRTEVVQGWATSPEQTLLDLADRPELGGATTVTVSEAITNLAAEVDWSQIEGLAREQRKQAALARARWLGAAVTAVPGGRKPNRRVPSKGLRPSGIVDPTLFGIDEA